MITDTELIRFMKNYRSTHDYYKETRNRFIIELMGHFYGREFNANEVIDRLEWLRLIQQCDFDIIKIRHL